MRNLDVMVAGAGIGGLTAALALQRHGFRVRVYEQAPELTEAGAGITLSPNGSKVLEHLGLAAVLERLGSVPTRRAIKHYRTGRELISQPAADMRQLYGGQYYQLHRADLHAALCDAVRATDPGAIVLGRTVTGYSVAGSRVAAAFARGGTAVGDLLVGADGVKSAVRNALFGPESPQFTGFIAWRGLVPVNALPAGMVDPPSAISVGPGHVFTRYLIRHGSTLNYVAFARRDRWTEEGWAVPSEVADLVAEFGEFEGPVRTMLAATPPQLCFKWGLFNRPPLERWSSGPVALLGDAAHPFTPFMGQGAVMAIEDGMILARALAASSSLGEALERYGAARVGRANWVMASSLQRAEVLLARDPEQQLDLLGRTEESLGLFRYDAVTVPV